MCDLVIDWIVQQLSNDDSNLQELCEYVRKTNNNNNEREYILLNILLDAFIVFKW